MHDRELAQEVLNQIHQAAVTVLARFEPIKSANDFTNSPEGMEKLDAICMQLIAIGESLKNLDKITDQKLLVKYPDIDWKAAKGLRDIITHHYFDIDAEAIFAVCQNRIKPMMKIIKKMQREL